MKYLFAQFRCHLYLLCIGIWRGEFAIRAESDAGKNILVAAGKGSLSNGTVVLSRIFYNPAGNTQADIQTALNGWSWQKR